MAVLTSNYPASIDTTTTLGEVSNRAKSTLAVALTSGAETQISLSDASGFPNTGAVTIDNEIFYYSAKTGNVLTIEERGRQGTASAAHSIGASVYLRLTKGHWEVLRTAILAVETKLGVSASTPISDTWLKGTGVGTSSWVALSLASGMAITGGGTNRVLFQDASQNLATSSNLQFDGTSLSLTATYPAYNTISLQNTNSGGGVSLTNLDNSAVVVLKASSGNKLEIAGGVYTTGTSLFSSIQAVAGGGQMALLATQWSLNNKLIIDAAGTGNTATAQLQIHSTTEQLRIGYDTSNYYSTTVSATGTVTLDAVGTGAKFIFNDDVGIGVSPTYPLHIKKDQNAITHLAVENLTNLSGAASAVRFIAGGGFSYVGMNATAAGGAGGNRIYLYAIGDGVSLRAAGAFSDIRLFTGGDTERARIDNIGNMGLGTGSTSPSARLHTISITEQLRVGYDTSNYFKAVVGATGGVTFDAVGVGSQFTFNGTLNAKALNLAQTADILNIIRYDNSIMLGVSDRGVVTFGPEYDYVNAKHAPQHIMRYANGTSSAGSGLKLHNLESGSIVRLLSANNGLYIVTDTGNPAELTLGTRVSPADASSKFIASSGHWYITDGGSPILFGVGEISSGAKLHVRSTTEQLRLAYDATNYLSATVAATGATTLSVKTLNAVKFDDSAIAGNTRFFVYDVDNATLERVTVGAADSAGAGFKYLRIPN